MYWQNCRITDGTFGHTEYFQGLVDNVNDMTKSNDWFLLANDFAGYMKAQDEVDKVRHAIEGSHEQFAFELLFGQCISCPVIRESQ